MSIDMDKDKPVTFKIPLAMYEAIEELIRKDYYNSRSDLIRYAIDQLLENEGVKSPHGS